MYATEPGLGLHCLLCTADIAFCPVCVQEWDKELANVAQRLADQCVNKHDCDKCRALGECVGPLS